MRNIIARLHMSSDGIVERLDRWLPVPDDLVTGTETVLVGRKTYNALAPEAARKLVVASRPVMLQPNSEVLIGDPARVLRALKQVPGDDLYVVGSVTLVRSLLRWRLLDEVSLVIHPVVAGFGEPLFEDRLRLISMCAGPGGVVEASYRVNYAATATSSRSADSAGRWGGTWSSDSVASVPKTAIRTHA
ncbi:dihydrofolate reductase [Kribbella antiqua]|uniref:Dihydrofolate reductase n=1 Tax=Kribbella antiqua TaxID=2512217 RepID=A0A4R2IU81_9ACTN|nr:dihydrofolate reductase family protein [Kribbella antiqua]TCO47688.1 dihydrofolate reductase [Kribbella antiqua]